MSFTLPDLPYAANALEPHVSARTLEFHHGKHHATYLANLNDLTKDTPLAKHSLEEVIKATAGDAPKAEVFNNAAQVWNHTFFWNSMKPGGGGSPSGKVAKAIDESFGSFDKFAEAFTTAATTQFGSGWAWLVSDGGKLKTMKTPNAVNPMAEGAGRALLTIDVWEHAYYLDYQNRRPDFIKAYLNSLVNWDFAAKNLG